jgi:hypothetical protein
LSVFGLVAWLLVASPDMGEPSPGQADVDCGHAERKSAKDFSLAALAMEPEASLRKIYDQATQAQKRCPDSEALAYYSLRAAELGKGALFADPAAPGNIELAALAHETAQRFSRSVRIATIEARATGDERLAREAVKLDPNYPPAQVALAAILLGSGDAKGALATIERVKGLAGTSDGYAVLARAQYAAGDRRAARLAAGRALKDVDPELAEPDARDPRPAMVAHQVLGMINLDEKRYLEAARHLLAADPNAPEVKGLLAKPPLALQRALKKARRPR